MKAVLVADDAKFMRKVIIDAIHNFNLDFELYEAVNGEETVEKFKKYNPEIIFMDIDMPLMNGIVASKKILEINPSTKIVMLSGIANKEILESIRSLGIMDFISKPFNDQKLLEIFLKTQNSEKSSATPFFNIASPL